MKYILQLSVTTLLVFSVTAVTVGAKKETLKLREPRSRQIHIAITEARQKMLERDRQGAVLGLQMAIRKEKTRAVQQELIEELHKLATLFISDEGLRAFELANAIRFSGQNNYMSKYSEALNADPHNWSIFLHQTLGYLQQKKCKQAQEVVTLADAVDPLRTENIYLKIKIQLCNKEEVSSELMAELAFVDDKKIYKDSVLAQIAAVQQKKNESLRYAAQAILSDKNYPMGYYWSWFALKEHEFRALEFAQKYSALCRGMTPLLRQKYYLEPELCVDLEAVESFVKNEEASP